jgi:hypothetical protein
VLVSNAPESATAPESPGSTLLSGVVVASGSVPESPPLAPLELPEELLDPPLELPELPLDPPLELPLEPLDPPEPESTALDPALLELHPPRATANDPISSALTLPQK